MMPITLTPAAELQLNQIMKQHPQQHVRVRLNNKGCSGHSYEWQLISDSDIKKFDLQIKLSEGSFVVEAASMLKLWGSTLDYHEDALGSEFKWLNPNVKHTCGCGESVGF